MTFTAAAPTSRKPSPRERLPGGPLGQAPIGPQARQAERCWLAAALALALLFSARTMAPALSPDIVQDDVRQHVFWMARFRDPELFRDDLIADYYEAIAPPGYKALYWILSWVVDPLVASKLLPPFLGLASALFVFQLVRHMYPGPLAPFLASVLMSWYVWQYDDLASGTPRAFVVPLLAALLWSLAAGRLALAVGLVLLILLFYPAAAAVGLALLGVRLLRFEERRLKLTRDRASWLAVFAASVLAALVLVWSQMLGSRFGPLVSAAQARTMPEFREDGRHAFFVRGMFNYWIREGRSGLNLSATDAVLGANVPILFEYAALAALLPLVLLLRSRLPSVRRLTDTSHLVLHLLLASFALFFLAHLLLFRLYLPNRYVKWSLPLVLAIAGGLGLAILVEEIATRVSKRPRLTAGSLAAVCAATLALYPARHNGLFVPDQHPTITAYVEAQPKDTLVAGVPSEIDLVPVLAKRRILTGREHTSAWHLGYYEVLRERTESLIEAYYSESPEHVAEFAARYGVDLFLVNRDAFSPRRFTEAWSDKFKPFTTTVASKIRENSRFALLDLAERCSVLDDGLVAVVPTSCIWGVAGTVHLRRI